MTELVCEQKKTEQLHAISKPLVTHMYSADPSAHVFNGKIYIYPSHDIESEQPQNDNGDHFDMRDYHVISLDQPFGQSFDHGKALDINDIEWAERQMWAPDAAEKDGKYFLYYPAKNYQGIFHIGVAVADKPEGPFTPEANHIEGTYSIDPAVFQDDDNSYYLYFGGISGGQLQNWQGNTYGAEAYPKAHEPALCPKVARLDDSMLNLAEEPRDIIIVDDNGEKLTAGDIDRRYFEGPWLHKHNGKYYFSYSTGETHRIAYATSDSPYGPFTYQGVILEPVIGWTTHHSIAQFEGKWYLFYHDSSLSGGETHLRCIKMTELIHDDNGDIKTITPYVNKPHI
ncbi:alpha-N-arabinofuranosidase [Vibrio sp. 10N.286.49.C2]|uniref:glycoside hydrolase family 43 protein n=1 Tax=unclassified Vibrio TaxID=2614977 RepID=UPI000C83D776|nr:MULTISPECIES: glycoside hydrolase family 43 protein [unclassified Vibrio]PMH42757.1 alpha-N-arabinofuranosidase [Vibrio sp. 10N.286.49.C2]PMH53905.1 alpha-N-arabinofuranosidase [Vibrio sp. 10N.286.49.B1]PMH79498.1 alpha-N-arabinofuranosidase [Vibrio sp. 10N.286.48.B7]